MPENLWALREQKKISVATLASRAGLPIALIMEYESGQRGIDPRHLGRLARALYVEEADIRLQSEPRPGAAPLERVKVGDSRRPTPAPRPPAPTPIRERPPRPAPLPKPPAPPRPSQLAHLDHLLKRLGRTRAELEAALSKPLTDLDRAGLSAVLKQLQAEVRSATVVERHRAYLPEGVEEHEARYLTAVQQAQDTLHFTLFDGRTVTGQVIGFGPYNITVRQADGDEITLNKLALVSYRKSQERAP